MTSKQVTSPPWNSRRLVHSKEMVWASRWSVALRAFYRQILSLTYRFFSLKLPPPACPGTTGIFYTHFDTISLKEKTNTHTEIFSKHYRMVPVPVTFRGENVVVTWYVFHPPAGWKNPTFGTIGAGRRNTPTPRVAFGGKSWGKSESIT